MPIQIMGLRPYFDKELKRKKLSNRWFNIEAESTSRLFEKIQEIVNCIPESERYNLFYTLSHTAEKNRSREKFISCDVIGFDIDDIALKDKEMYLEPLQTALKVDLSKCVVVWTGNGVQIIIKLKESVGKEFFDNKDAYGYWCERINKGLESLGLPGHADSSVFEPARVFRLPLTKNIKPMEEADTDQVIVREAILFNGNLEYCGWELGEDKKEKTESKLEKDFVVDIASVMKECLFMKNAMENQESLIEPQWRAALGISAWFPDDQKTSHALSCKYPGYSYEETQAKIDQIREAVSGPRLCDSISPLWDGCKGCAHYKKVKTPLQIKSSEFHLKELDVFEHKKPSEMQVVYQLLKNFQIDFNIEKKEVFGGDFQLMKDRESGEIFKYTGTHWELFKDSDELCAVIDKYYSFQASNSKTESTYKHFLKYLPKTAEKKSFFALNPFLLNCSNGTVHLIEDEEGNFSLKLLSHKKKDLLTYCMPYEFNPESSKFNSKFMDMLNRCFDFKIEPSMAPSEIERLQKDKDDKIMAIAQMYGAALMPAFPQVFFLEGITRSGKSQVAMCLYHLIGAENFSSVEPHEMHGFQMESMAGKLLNLVTDITTSQPISANIFKQIEDRVPKRIQRKNRQDLLATIPAIHVFAGNEMPKNFDSSSQAYARRATILKFTNQVPEGIDRKNFAEHVFNFDSQGIFNFAIWGLQTLIKAKGFFHKPASSIKAMNQWTNDNDVIALFLEDFGEGCLTNLKIENDLRINRTDLWNFFDEWRIEAGRKNSKMTRNGFYSQLEKKGFQKKCTHGKDQFKGIGKVEGDNEIRF